MGSGYSALRPALIVPSYRRRLVGADADFTRFLMALSGALAVSGLAELFLQRVVYRVGIHIPRSGIVLDMYNVATASGDFAFRTTAVLLAVVALLAVAWMAHRGDYVAAGLLSTLIVVNALAWPLRFSYGALAAPLVFASAAAWIGGSALARPDRSLVRFAAVPAALALMASQYVAGMAAAGQAPAQVGTLQLLSEISLLLTAAFVGVAAALSGSSLRAVALASALTLVLTASYLREPTTLAIVSLWATGVTMSLPGMVYIAGFGAFAYAATIWALSAQTRHLAVALALLLVAGLQPQALHHGITAFLGLAFLSMGAALPAAPRTQMEVSDGI